MARKPSSRERRWEILRTLPDFEDMTPSHWRAEPNDRSWTMAFGGFEPIDTPHSLSFVWPRNGDVKLSFWRKSKCVAVVVQIGNERGRILIENDMRTPAGEVDLLLQYAPMVAKKNIKHKAGGK